MLETIGISFKRREWRSFSLMLMIGLAAMMICGCSGSGSGDSSGPVVKEGVFVDSVVEGLEYRTDTRSGITDSGGRFHYVEGETIEFFIGGIIIGSTKAAPVITPVDLVEGAEDETDDRVTNIARFLLTLDNDADPENGISIVQPVREAAATLSIDFSMTVVSFETNSAVIEAVSTLTTLTLAGERGLISITFAQLHLRITLNNLDDYDDADEDGFSEEQGDCADDDPSIYPNADEICGDGIDQDCDGQDLICATDPDVDDDADSMTENQGDCNDADDTVYPGAEEICGDGIDQNCDGTDLVCDDDDGDDDGDDDDGDDDGNDEDGDDDDGDDDDGDDDGDDDLDADNDGFTVEGGDCNDNDAAINPGAFDICGNGVDENCDGADTVCVTPPTPPNPNDVDNDNDGYTENQGDCNDADPAINPGSEDICGNGTDENCDGSDLDCDDVDGDGDNYSVNQGDCNDTDAAVFPGAAETCGDGIDQDCNGADLICTEEGVLLVGEAGIEGVEYQTETQSGVTDKDGRFRFLFGETVTFSIGRIMIGDITLTSGVSPILTIVDLVGGAANETDPTAINICRFLMTLDDDGNPDNGITIGALVRRFATMTVNFSLSPEEFEKNEDVESAVWILTGYRSEGRRLLVFAFRARIILQFSLWIEDSFDNDQDGDGVTVGNGDCNDFDDTIFPGAEEICSDGIDQDCDGEDTICPEDLAKDEDADGVTVGGGDCNDTDDTVYPGAEEIADDGIDQDCDGEDLISPVIPVDGTFEGIILDADGNDVGDIRFSVDDDDVSGLTADLIFSGTCTGTETVEAGSASLEIEDGRFVFAVADWEISGTFMSDTEVEGTWFYRDPTCDGEATGTGTWTATAVPVSEDPLDVDDDGDGFSENKGDCNDADIEIHPGAEEPCGGTADLDCDTFLQTCAPDGAELLEGKLLLGNITGLEFRTETQHGRTMAGVFTYLAGEMVTFYLGGIIIAEVPAAPELTPFDLAVEPYAAFNICKFLLTLDDDDDLSDGILIADAVRLAAYHVSLNVVFTVDEPVFAENADVARAMYLLTFHRTAGRRLLVLQVKVEELLAEFLDNDEDGFSEYEGDCDDEDELVYPGTETCPVPDGDNDGYTTEAGDCNDTDPNIYPGVGDCPATDIDFDEDGVTVADGDCNDEDPAVYPGAEEICGDGIDQDCDGADLICTPNTIVEGDWSGATDQEKAISFTVADGKVSNISVIMNYVGGFDDMNCELGNLLQTGNAEVEIVDGRFAFSTSWVEVAGTFISPTEAEGTWFYENTLCQGDGSGIWTATVSGGGTDLDSDGITVEQGDCNDEDDTVYPGAGEICGDGIDQDCDGEDLACEDSDLGTLILSLTADYLDENAYQAAFVTVKEIQIQGPGGWLVVESDLLPKTYPLFDLAAGMTELLVEGRIPAGLEGKYNQIRLILAKEPDDETIHPFANYIVLPDGEMAVLKVPSGFQTGLKIKHKFTIVKGRTTELKLTFNALRSIRGKNGKWKLKPVLKVTEVATPADPADDTGTTDETGDTGATDETGDTGTTTP